jgi:hypothetical protein
MGRSHNMFRRIQLRLPCTGGCLYLRKYLNSGNLQGHPAR